MTSEKIWVQSKWKCEDLHTESVEFKLPVQGGEAYGVGQFIVATNPEGLLSIDIRTILRGESPAGAATYDFHLNQWAVDRIERHPDPKTADFRCLG